VAESIYAAKNDYTFLANKKQKLGSVFGFLLANVLCNRLYAEMFLYNAKLSKTKLQLEINNGNELSHWLPLRFC